jgi:hypothetical protein
VQDDSNFEPTSRSSPRPGLLALRIVGVVLLLCGAVFLVIPGPGLMLILVAIVVLLVEQVISRRTR